MYQYKSIPRHRKGLLPRAGTCSPFNREYCLRQGHKLSITATEEQIVQAETCFEQGAETGEEQVVQTEVCETEVTESSPKKRRQKRDKVASSIKE